MADDPFELFDTWFGEARAAELNDPEAMAVATTDAGGQPSVRMVLLKGHSPAGFIFYTNDGSAKGRQLAANPRAALLFHWKSLRRQVRIEGSVERVPADEADLYYASRIRDSQLGAWASDQSRALDRRETLEARFTEAAKRFEGEQVPRPSHWSGYRVVPARIEFWRDGAHRLHHRRLFTRSSGGGWDESLLYP